MKERVHQVLDLRKMRVSPLSLIVWLVDCVAQDILTKNNPKR